MKNQHEKKIIKRVEDSKKKEKEKKQKQKQKQKVLCVCVTGEPFVAKKSITLKKVIQLFLQTVKCPLLDIKAFFNCLDGR